MVVDKAEMFQQHCNISNLPLEPSTPKTTKLPDSLNNAAILATSESQYNSDAGSMAQCCLNFDTSISDETYTKLKSSTEFMQKFVTAVCYEMIPGVKEIKEGGYGVGQCQG